MEPIYRGILKKSWQLIKTHRWLWFFGLFVAFLGNGGEIDILLQHKKLTNAPDYLSTLKETFSSININELGSQILDGFLINSFWSFVSILFLIAIFVLFIWLITVSQGGIIQSAYSLGMNKKINFREALAKGQEKFWSILGLNVITNFIIYFFLIILSLPFAVLYLGNESQAAIIFITILAFIILIPVAIIISFVLKYAFIYVVVKNQTALTSFYMAWKLFFNNWLISIEMALLLFAINFIAGLAMIFAMIVMGLPFFGLMLLMLILQNETGFNTTIALGVIMGVVLLLFTGAILSSFQFTAWTLLWQKLQNGKNYSKLVRLTTKKINKAK